MENKKQNSIEWLIEQLIKYELVPKEIHFDNILFHQARAMHRKEIISSYKNAMASAYFNTHNWMPQEGYIHKAEHYYNETFGGQDNE